MPKNRIDIIASTETFENLSPFESVAELNEAIRHYKRVFADELTRTDIAVLELLQRYSCRYLGVSFLRKNKIAEALGKSRRTIIRVCNKLAQLGIVRQYEMKRATDMQQTSNAIVIQPVISEPVAQDPPKDTDAMSPIKQPQAIKQNLINKRTERPFKPAWIPEAFFDLLHAHYDEVKEITEYWRGVYASTYGMNLTSDDKERIAIESFFEMKSRRRKLRKPIAYFIGVVKRKAKRVHITNLFNSVFEL
ncbi:helix-turn-helix domain-containing protein [Heyndrickxia sp. FSL K6-6286]|uniref:helix-turn-helix domain-containing protein n=1 Tax=Heyndrickxia sp. FSL K6-6286 TaxID=2921510 RepID=UPI00315A39F4